MAARVSMGIQYSDAAGPEGMRIYAIGDVHGRRDLLEIMHARIDGELARDRPADWRIIHLGDYVDRGPDSAGVVEMVSKRVREDSRVLALAGNHETKFLSFLASPEQWRQFADFGGEETAQSYGVDIDFTNAKGIREGHAALVRAVPESHLNFLVNLGYSASFGDFFFCHAGIKPGLPLEQQDSHDLTWIRGEFLNYPALHPKVIVHGHTPHDAPEVMANRVNLDTLAYWSGILTALAIDGAEKRIFNVTGKISSGRR